MKIKIRWADVVVAVGTTIAIMVMLVWMVDLALESDTPDWARGYEPCMTEDQTQWDCYWDAENRGNGQGQSFLVKDGQVIYK